MVFVFNVVDHAHTLSRSHDKLTDLRTSSDLCHDMFIYNTYSK